jgi:protein-disulfide isomerase
MSKINFKIIIPCALGAAALIAAPFVLKLETAPQQAQATTEILSEAQKTAIDTQIKDFIMNNPEVLMESVNKMRERETAAQDEQAKQSLGQHKNFLFNNPKMPAMGAKNPDITVVEFLDYNCGFCKKAFEAMVEVMESDPKVRFVLVEIPILSESSRTAAEFAMAAHKQGKYAEFHQAVMMFNGPKTEETILAEARKIGLDIEKLKADAKSKEVQDFLAEKEKVAADLAVRGTPAFIVGDQIIRGYVPAEALKTLIKDAQSKS